MAAAIVSRTFSRLPYLAVSSRSFTSSSCLCQPGSNIYKPTHTGQVKSWTMFVEEKLPQLLRRTLWQDTTTTKLILVLGRWIRVICNTWQWYNNFIKENYDVYKFLLKLNNTSLQIKTQIRVYQSWRRSSRPRVQLPVISHGKVLRIAFPISCLVSNLSDIYICISCSNYAVADWRNEKRFLVFVARWKCFTHHFFK